MWPIVFGVGLQSFNPELLKRMQRPYGRERFGPAIEQLSKVAFNIEVQIIFGLPTDSWDGFLETLNYALSLPVTGVSPLPGSARRFADSWKS